MLSTGDEPPLTSESRKIKISKGNGVLERINNSELRGKIKNHLNNAKQFLARGSEFARGEILSKSVKQVKSNLKSAKSFLVDQRYTPHLIVVFLGIIVALCNVLVARGADNLYNLIPADPSSQIAIASSIGRYTPLIPNSTQAVEAFVTTSADPNSGVFATDTKTTATTVTTREEPAAAIESGPREKNIYYTVADGDTLSGLSMRFNVKVSSIQFANDLSNADFIKPGQNLKIPPDGWEPSASQIAAKKKTTVASSSSKTKTVNSAPGRVNNGYPYGYCTYYVATRRAVPTQWGNAGQWLNSAKRAGYSTGSSPLAGSIVVTRESWWGHVAYVESVSGGSFTVAEMNVRGWGVISRRTISVGDSVIKGFIY